MNTIDIEKEFNKMIESVNEIKMMTYKFNLKK